MLYADVDKQVDTEFWRDLAKLVGGTTLTPKERQQITLLFEIQGEPELDPHGADIGREDALASAAEVIRATRGAGLSRSDLDEGIVRGTDPRWELLADLEGARGRAWSALKVSGGGMKVDPIHGEHAPLPIRITVDPRVPFRTLSRELERIWRLLREEERVLATRPLDDRKLALLRHVCLEMPETSWRSRWEAWNARFPEWAYRSPSQMTTACHTAEESLTGDRHGLAWHYERAARLPLDELHRAAEAGDRGAKRERQRRRQMWREGIDQLRSWGVDVVEGSAPLEKRGGKERER